MRNIACKELVSLFNKRKFTFLTGDLGFQALEPLREAMGSHFINAGVAEQNMVTVAAGLTRAGFQAWVYSIAPFLFARAFEQIRNDVCLNGAPVKLIGNGGGYAYGSMGSTHHAIEDCGVMLALKDMRVYVPAFNEDIPPVIEKMSASPFPEYLRLGKSEKPKDYTPPPYAPWRKLTGGGANGVVLLAVGPLAGALLGQIASTGAGELCQLWALSELPGLDDPGAEEFAASVAERKKLVVVEEHVAQGGAGQMIALWLKRKAIMTSVFEHRHALGYPSGLYGSQTFHRKECGLDPASVVSLIKSILAGK